VDLAFWEDVVRLGMVTSTKAAGKAATKKERGSADGFGGAERGRAYRWSNRAVVLLVHHPVVVVVNKNKAAPLRPLYTVKRS
jgi:hypothetical protein